MYKIGCIFFFVIICMLSVFTCNVKKDLYSEIQDRAEVDSAFEKQGHQLSAVTLESGKSASQVKALQLSETALQLLVNDQQASIKGLRAQALIKQKAEVKIDTIHTVFHDSLPCPPFRIDVPVLNLWYSMDLSITNKTHDIFNLVIPFTETTTINERHRFLRGPEITSASSFDNPHLHLSQSSVAVVKKNKGIKVANFTIPIGIGMALGIFLEHRFGH